LPRALTQTTLPLADATTRTGEQPAATVAITARLGSRSALPRLTTLNVPTSLVAYNQRPLGETVSPTGAVPSGTDPR
jgi:hypothetical protein